jgi:(4S)-4-hydroxy-5-phosphonooxypentane-2,3-dione isomerase
MSKLAIVAAIEIQPGRMDDALPLLMAHRARCLKDEPGTLHFEVLRPRDDDTRVLFYEVYADDAAFLTHWNGPLVAQCRKETKGLVGKISGTRCTLQEVTELGVKLKAEPQTIASENLSASNDE